MYAFLIFNIKEVIEMFRIYMYVSYHDYFLVREGVVEMFVGMGKYFKVCRYAFLFI